MTAVLARAWVALAAAGLAGTGLAPAAPGLGGAAGAVAPPPGGPGQSAPEVRLLTMDGVINPVTARYLERGLRDAEEDGAAAVVLRLDTPGGLEAAMREMIGAILGSSVPVVVYVAPPGARAASAGLFLTLAGHVAAMAPGTNIGAAYPVGLGGQADPAATRKLAQDAAALARSLAALRGRNAAWAERAVLASESITAAEALELGVVDLLAENLAALLAAANGRVVSTPRGAVALRTAGARVVEQPISFAGRVLQVITDPNIAYLLFTLGIIGILAELYHPGIFFPGIAGTIALVLAFVAFGNLPVGWAGVILILLAVGLFIAELLTEGIGLLAVAGVVAFVLGSLLLYTPVAPASPVTPELRVSPWLVALMAIAIGAFFVFVVRALLRVRRRPVETGVEQLLGRKGTALTDIAPAGMVRVDSEAWSALSEEPIREGERVEVIAVEGVTLRVRRI